MTVMTRIAAVTPKMYTRYTPNIVLLGHWSSQKFSRRLTSLMLAFSPNSISFFSFGVLTVTVIFLESSAGASAMLLACCTDLAMKMQMPLFTSDE